MSTLSVDLPEDVSSRLEEWVQRTGRSKMEYMVDALTEHLNEMDGLRVAEERFAEHRAGVSRSYSVDEVEQRLGLAD